MEPRHRIFSLEQANAILPELESLLGVLELKQETFRRLEEELFFVEILEKTSPPEIKFQELETALLALEGEIDRIRELGCFLRHVERGLVDFLAQRERDQKWIYYCWRRGEKEIQYYHTPGGGFLERQPLTESEF